jgi:hypothetical protein
MHALHCVLAVCYIRINCMKPMHIFRHVRMYLVRAVPCMHSEILVQSCTHACTTSYTYVFLVYIFMFEYKTPFAYNRFPE